MPVLLVTPQFASWIDPANPLFGQWVNPLFDSLSHTTPPEVAYTVTAVVDSIPIPLDRVVRNTPGIYANTPGREGLSLLIADSSDVTVKAAEPPRTRSATTTEPAFYFSSAAAKDDHGGQISHKIGLRLANTVFVNGKDRTIMGARWIYNTESGGYTVNRSYDLSLFSITCPATAMCRSLSVPLHPITQRRRVVSSMGNILRQLSKSPEGDSDDAIPASSELERELPRYVSELGIPHQRVSVWALVEPSELSSERGRSSPASVEESIRSGGRLHRVISGGGGWGKKQGLLSLDPERTFTDETSIRSPVGLERLFDERNEVQSEALPDLSAMLGRGLEEDIASLNQIAKAGDHIQFLVSTEPHDEDVKRREGIQKQGNPLICSFVVGASSEDALGGHALHEGSETSTSEKLVVLPNYFGGLSETAISYSLDSEKGIEDLQCSTKISVPGARIELQIS